MADLATAARNVFKLCLNPTSGMGGGGQEEDDNWVLLGKWRTDWKASHCIVVSGSFLGSLPLAVPSASSL